MSNPTCGEIIEAQIARQWAERNKTCEVSSPEIQAAADFILAHTTPPTMAEIEWDDDKHYLAEAEHPEYGKVVMLSMSSLSGEVFTLFKGDGVIYTPCVLPKNLTPTGKRYTLTEVQE